MALRMTVADQIRFADERGHVVTPRQLERYRHEGLMPRPQKTEHDGRKGVPTYPARSGEQLVCLRELDPAVTGEARVVALAMAGFQIELAVLQRALASQLREIEVGVWAFAERCAVERGGDPLEALAERIALARPRGIDVPRKRGQVQSARVAAVRYVLKLFLLGEGSGENEAEAEAERLIGMDRARKDPLAPLSTPWLVGRWADGFAAVGSLPALRAAVDAARSTEIDDGVRLARVFHRLLPVAAMAIGAETKRPNRGGFAWMQRLRVAPGPTQAMWIAFMVSVLRSPMRANALDVAAALAPFEVVRDGVERLLAMPSEERHRRLGGLPSKDRARMTRLLAAARERDPAGLQLDTRHEDAWINVQTVGDP